MASKIAAKVGRKYVGNAAAEYEAADPLYETYTNDRGKVKRRRRAVPAGLNEHDARVLKKVRKRAHYLDKGMSLCGFRVGWCFWLGLIPGAGDAGNFALGYMLVIKPSRSCDLPSSVSSRLLLNQMLASGVGLVPFVGDIVSAAYKPNSRNAWLLEEYLIERSKTSGGDPESQGAAVVQKSRGWSWSAKTGDPSSKTGAATNGSAQPAAAGSSIAAPPPAATSPAKR